MLTTAGLTALAISEKLMGTIIVDDTNPLELSAFIIEKDVDILVAPFEKHLLRKDAVVLAGFWGWLFWGQVPDQWSLLGSLLVIAGGLLTIYLARGAATIAVPE